MNDRYLYKAKKKNWREFPKETQWVVGYITHKPTGEWQILRKCDNPPDGDPMWQKVLIAYEIDPYTICQCTGLKDKNGKLIWENDVVNCYESECFGVIKWEEDEARFIFDIVLEDLSFEPEDVYDYIDDMEVVGNTFDNPELLEVEVNG